MSLQKTKSQLIELTKAFVNRPDCIQGPGGNTSVKSDETMFIKASGMRFEEMNENTGISAVNFQPISKFLSNVIPYNKEVDEQQLLDIVEQNRLLDEHGKQFPKPSMETGFHAALKNYVVHTHSVWTNLINCAENRLELIEKLKSRLKFKLTELPFVSPGFTLSYLVSEKIKECKLRNEEEYDVFLLANHGIIAHGNDSIGVVEILEKVDEEICAMLNIEKHYPNTELVQTADNSWKPKSDFVNSMIQSLSIDKHYFDTVLFPDQIVFFKDNLGDNLDESKKITLNSGDVIYQCSEREAISIHETMTAYLFIQNQLKTLKLMPKAVNTEDINYINNMAMEKHRKNLMKE